MRFLRYGAAGKERPAVEHLGVTFDLRGLTSDIDGRFLGRGGLGLARSRVLAGTLPVLDIAGERLGAPVARPPAVLCIGQNYAAHAAESGAEPPGEPVVFLKHPGCVVGAFDDVRIPPGSTATDWEVELAIVIGRPARYLPTPEHAPAVIAGYTISNDVSEREYQLRRSGGQWSKGKSCETFNPLGPWLVAAEDLPEPQNLRLRSWVNGDPRQDSSTADMIFDVRFLVWHLSQFVVLQPGDVINTGTPQGVALSGRFPYLSPGDVMRLEISGLGVQEQRLVANRDGAHAVL